VQALASTCLMSILLLLSMSFQERVERLGVEQTVGVRGTERSSNGPASGAASTSLTLSMSRSSRSRTWVRDPVLGCEVLSVPPASRKRFKKPRSSSLKCSIHV